MLTMVRAGVDEQSFASVFQAHHRDAVRLAYLLCGDPFLAEDVVSEAFAAVYPRWQRGQVDDVRAYLRRAVANRMNSRFRRLYRERAEAQRRTGDERGVRRIDDDAADRDEVWQALQRLTPKQRAPIVLRYYHDMTEAEIADTLGISVGTVKSQVSHGMKRLRQLLGAETEGGA